MSKPILSRHIPDAGIMPECASVLYGYQACAHEFDNGRCLKCYWDGSGSTYIKKLKQAKS